MTNFLPVNREQHKNSAYKSTANYKFTAEMSVVPVLQDEIGFVIANMCLAFRKISLGAKETYELVALQSLMPKKNLFILPDGRWIRGYRPAFYRSYPFALLPAADSQPAEPAAKQSAVEKADTKSTKLVLSIDEQAVSENPDEKDLPFFDEDGKLAPKLQQTVKYLGECLQNKQKTFATGSLLASHGLLVPWPIRFTSADDQQQKKAMTLEGLFHISSEVLQELSADILQELNSKEALKVAYAQLLSESRLKVLAERATAFKKFEQQKLNKQQNLQESPDLDDLFANNDDLLSF